jgi:hypothetical protein
MSAPTMAEEQRKTDELTQLIAELNELREEDCSCPCELDGPAKSNDFVYRTRHIDRCQFAVFVRKVYDAATRSVLQEIVAGMEQRGRTYAESVNNEGLDMVFRADCKNRARFMNELLDWLRSTYGVTAGKE